MSIPDYLTTFSTAQAFTTEEVSDNVILFGSDAERNEFINTKDHIIRLQVTTVFAGMASGLRVQFRIDTAASLASGSQLIVAETQIIPVADLVANARFYLRVNPRRWPDGYDYAGLWYAPVSEAASGGNISAALVDGAEDMVDQTV
jgi:hypothetical protein